MSPSILPGLVSTIIPVFNRPLLVRDAVESVLAQTHRPIEIIVVDDESTDETPQTCQTLAERHSEVAFVRVAHGGPGLAREAGRQRARGEYIQYLDSDDLLRPRKFEWQVAALAQRPECGVAYGPTEEHDIHAPERRWRSLHVPLDTLFPSLLSFRPWRTLAPLFRRSVTDAVGAWSDLVQEEDIEYDARVAARGTRLATVTGVVADIRHHATSRASGGSHIDPVRMRSRARSHAAVYAYARTYGVDPSSPHLQRYSRELFLLARQCGASGLGAESQKLFALAREAGGAIRGRAWDFHLYAATAALLGWGLAGRLACRLDAVRPQRGQPPPTPPEAV